MDLYYPDEIEYKSFENILVIFFLIRIAFYTLMCTKSTNHNHNHTRSIKFNLKSKYIIYFHRKGEIGDKNRKLS